VCLNVLPRSLSLPACLPPSAPSRPAGPAERAAHRAAAGDGAPLPGAAPEGQPPRLPAAVRQAAAEDDGPAADRDRPRAPHPAAAQDRGGHVLTPAAAGDREGLVLDMTVCPCECVWGRAGEARGEWPMAGVTRNQP